MNQTVHDTTETAKDKAREAGSQAQDKAKSQIDDRSTQAGDQLQQRADSLHEMGDQMRDRGDDTFAQVADRVAGWTEDAARYLREADADRLLGDVEAYARRQPWAVAAGGALLGFAASRIVRAGTDRRRESSGSLGYGSSYEPLGAESDIDLRGPGTSAGTGYGGTTAGYTAGYTDPLSRDPLSSPTGYGASGSVSPPEPQPGIVPDVDPVPDTNPSPLGDPVPQTDPEPSTGFDRPAHVER